MQRTALQWLRQVALAWLLATILVACSSPEDGRPRGGGAGADVGNMSSQFKPDSKIFRSSTTP